MERLQPLLTMWGTLYCVKDWLNVCDKSSITFRTRHSTTLPCCPWKSVNRNSLLQHAYACAHTHTELHLPVWTFRKRERSLALAERTDICTFCTERELKKCRKYNSTGLGCHSFDRQILITNLSFIEPSDNLTILEIHFTAQTKRIIFNVNQCNTPNPTLLVNTITLQNT
jgi:hypothetical protein